MKIIGLDGSNILLSLTLHEWRAIGGKSTSNRNGPGYVPDTEPAPPDVRKLVESLRAIEAASPELERIRATFQMFLLLTEPAAIAEVLKSAGVAETVEEEIVLVGEEDEI